MPAVAALRQAPMLGIPAQWWATIAQGKHQDFAASIGASGIGERSGHGSGVTTSWIRVWRWRLRACAAEMFCGTLRRWRSWRGPTRLQRALSGRLRTLSRECQIRGGLGAAVRWRLCRDVRVTGLELSRPCTALGEQPIAPRRWPRLIIVSTAGSGLHACGFWQAPSPAFARNRRLLQLEQARRTHRVCRASPMDVVGPDCASIASWFRGRVDFAVHAPRMPRQITCQGGRLVNVEDRPAAYLVYQDPAGHRVSVLVFDPEATPNGS